ncbi:hypothetical protein [Rubritalea tangerina]
MPSAARAIQIELLPYFSLPRLPHSSISSSPKEPSSGLCGQIAFCV